MEIPLKNNHFSVRLALGALALSGAALGCSTAPDPNPTAPPVMEGERTTPSPLQAALEHPGRTPQERARDASRHPAQTLEFFGVKPQHTVFELWSGGGWYTHILAPYLADQGKLYVTAYPANTEVDYFRQMNSKMTSYLQEQGFQERVGVLEINTEKLDFGLKDEVDVVLTFRNVHNWVKGGYDKAVYEQAFLALKPGGVFGVVEHRGPAGMTREQSATTGYMDQDRVIADVEAVGFQFVGASEINANPKDTKDHPEGVWTLPPSLRLGDQDRDKYTAIGESDRMTLKFIKP
jgi:predicted methyltransferase